MNRRFLLCLFFVPTIATAQYRPLVDEAMIQDWPRFERDLAACQHYAARYAPARNAAKGAIVGAILGAAIGVAVGNNSDFARYGARVGAVSGAAQGAGGAVDMQITVMRNCMIGRGYQLLDAPTVAIAAPVSQRPCAVTPGAPGCQPPVITSEPAAVASDETQRPPEHLCAIAPGMDGCGSGDPIE